MGGWLSFTLAVLATWRVTHLLASEDGPADLIVRLRAALGESFAGKLLDCFYCLSLWVAAPLALFVAREPVEWLFGWLAASGGACLLERAFIGRQAAFVEPMSAPSPGDFNHVLRTETIAAQHAGGAAPASIGPRADEDEQPAEGFRRACQPPERNPRACQPPGADRGRDSGYRGTLPESDAGSSSRAGDGTLL